MPGGMASAPLMLGSKQSSEISEVRVTLALLALVICILPIRIARADWLHGVADLVCDPDHNIAVARFAETYNPAAPAYANLSPDLDRGLSSTSGTGRRSCQLANGWEIRIRNGVKQAYPYRVGGGSPPYFFSLWIDRRKVISQRVWSSYDYDNKPMPIAAVVISSSDLTFCEQARDLTRSLDPVGELTCTSQRLNLSGTPVDTAEYPPPGTAPVASGILMIKVGSSNNLCRNLERRGPREDGSIRPWIGPPVNEPDLPFPKDTVEWIDPSRHQSSKHKWPTVDGAMATFGVPMFTGQVHVPPTYTDFDNDNVLDTVVGLSDDSKFFDGSYWIVAPKQVPVVDLLRQLFSGEGHAGEGSDIERAEKRGWFVYSGGRPGLYPDVSPWRVHVERLYFPRETYLLAFPTDTRHDPTAMVVRPTGGGKFETTCVFQRQRLNY